MTENSKFTTAAFILGALIVLSAIVLMVALKPADCPVQLPCPKCEPVVVNSTIEVQVSPDYKAQVTEALMSEIQADKSYRLCDGDKYDVDEILLKKVYDGFVLTENSDSDLTISDVKVKLDYDQGDCYKTFTCALDYKNDLTCA